jgi:spore maturation protein CgeB
MRTHEALGCASAYLSFETLYHTKNFIKGTHMEWSNSADETLRIVDDLLKNESKRIRMGREGQKLVYARDNYASKARGIKNTYAIKYNIFNNAPYKSGGV